MDGDGDGFARADISTDEFWSGVCHSSLNVDQATVLPADVLSYKIQLINPGPEGEWSGVSLTDAVPAGTTYLPGSLSATSGAAKQSGDIIQWSGDIASMEIVTISFAVLTDPGCTAPHGLANVAIVSHIETVAETLQALTIINPIRTYLPASAVAYVFE